MARLDAVRKNLAKLQEQRIPAAREALESMITPLDQGEDDVPRILFMVPAFLSLCSYHGPSYDNDGILSVPVPVSVAPALTLACMSSYTCTV